MPSDFDPSLPQPPADPNHLDRLRATAAERVRREQNALLGTLPDEEPMYRAVSRRWSLRALFAVFAASTAAVAAKTINWRGPQAAVYGGPPPRPPQPPTPPVPPQPEPRKTTPEHPLPKHKHHKKHPPAPQPPRPEPPKTPRPPSTVYGGPPPR